MAPLRLRYPASLAVPGLLVAVTLLVLVLTLSAPLGGYGYASIYAYHPVFMTVAFLLLLPLGLLSYSLDLGEAGNRAYPDRDSRRVLHGVLQLLGTCLAVCGYLVAFVYHAARGRDHLALSYNPPIPSRVAHVFLGLFAVAGLVVMTASGLYKFVVAARDGLRARVKWHGMLGPAVWVSGLLCICLAAYFEFLENSNVPPQPPCTSQPCPSHWSAGQVAAIVIGVVAAAVGVAVQSRLTDVSHIVPGPELDDYESDKRGLLQ